MGSSRQIDHDTGIGISQFSRNVAYVRRSLVAAEHYDIGKRLKCSVISFWVDDTQPVALQNQLLAQKARSPGFAGTRVASGQNVMTPWIAVSSGWPFKIDPSCTRRQSIRLGGSFVLRMTRRISSATTIGPRPGSTSSATSRRAGSSMQSLLAQTLRFHSCEFGIDNLAEFGNRLSSAQENTLYVKSRRAGDPSPYPSLKIAVDGRFELVAGQAC